MGKQSLKNNIEVYYKMVKFKKLVKKTKTGARKGLLQGSKAALVGGRVLTSAGKAANMVKPNSGNKAIAGGRLAKKFWSSW